MKFQKKASNEMDYKGIIIEESLSHSDILEKLEIVHTEISPVTQKDETPWLEKWTMHTVCIKENEIDEYAEKLSDLIDTEHCGNWYCDFRNDEFHYVVFSNKVFKIDRTNKKDYIEMREYAISIGLPEYQLPNFIGE